jgi:EAL domain-containing protein (putative c-di-GMP-specific phosphodiesterase class I)
VANLVADARSLTLLVGAARLSADLGLRVTVEGIETLDQLALVRSEPFFHEAQGFLFSRAVSPTAISDMLLKRRAGWLPPADGNEDQGTSHEAPLGYS